MSLTDRSPARTSDSSGSLELAALTIVLILLFAIPSRLIFPPLGGAGSPTQMCGMALSFVWGLRWFAGYRPRRTGLHAAIALFLACVLTSYAGAALHPATVIETSAADRGLLSCLGWLGLFLTAADGLVDRFDLDTFMRRVVIGSGFVALIGVLKFLTKQQLTNYIQVPGLAATGQLALDDRNGFARPAGTALHAIEFGAVLTMILPFALHYAMHDRTRTMLRRSWPAIAIAVSIPISISRSAIVSSVVILVALFPTWARTTRRRAYLALLGLGAVMYVLVPGLLGTITGLFNGISNDDSTLSRTNSYTLAGEFIGRNPLFGRGFRTLLTSIRILDNQYLGLLIEVGIVGTIAALGLFVTTIVVSRRVRRASTDPATRSLAQAYVASVASAACSMALFDMFAFPMAVSLLFLLIGSAAAFRRMTMTANSTAARERD